MKATAQIKSKTIVIEDLGIQSCSSNGGRKKTVLFQNEKKERFRIRILSESFESQSFAILEKWTDANGFSVIIRKNPKADFQIDISYKDNYSASAFEPIVKDLKRISESF